MPRSANQKLKLLCLCRILWERTDEDHPLTVPELIQALEAWDIKAERKSIYDDMEALRARAVEVALSYQGTQYRWGGKSPLGVDCSGLTFMAWFFCGVSLYRDARLVDGFPARPIPFEARKPGDLLYFPGHIALYLGNDRYIHSTARAGSDGVMINSLDPAAPDYRADLREKLYAVGSVFPLA